VNACGSSTALAGTNVNFAIIVAAEFSSASCVINLPNHSLGYAYLDPDAQFCTFSRGSTSAPQDLYVTTTNTTLTLTRSGGSTWLSGSVVYLHCKHSTNLIVSRVR